MRIPVTTCIVGLLAVVGLAGCAARAPRTDRLCVELARYANSPADAMPRRVELTTRWRPFEKGCTHGGQAAGARFCRWLLSNVSTERPEANVQRVMSCFQGAETYAGQPALRAEYLAGKLVAHDALGVRDGVDIGVEYAIGIENGPSVLTLSVAEAALE